MIDSPAASPTPNERPAHMAGRSALSAIPVGTTRDAGLIAIAAVLPGRTRVEPVLSRQMRRAVARDQTPELDGVRAIAAGAVVAFHVWYVAGAPRLAVGALDVTWPFSVGAAGVELFFVLSGFLMTAAWLRMAQDSGSAPLRTYWTRRLLRIVPAYYASVAVLAVLSPPPAPGFSPPTITIASVAAHLAFAPFLSLAPAINGVYWSLSTEMQFYLVLPLLAGLFSGRRWWKGLAICVLAALAWRGLTLAVVTGDDPVGAGVGIRPYVNNVVLLGRLDAFGFGMATWALWRKLARERSLTRSAAFTVTGLVLLVLGVSPWPTLVVIGGENAIWYFVAPTLAAAGFAAITLGAVLAAGPLLRFWRLRPLRSLGVVSYSVYLWHLPIITSIAAALSVAGVLSFGALAVLAVPAVITAATISYVCLERPFIELSRRAGGAREPAEARPSTFQLGRWW